jgi:thiol-disulfide isomerase/thioredoxin
MRRCFLFSLIAYCMIPFLWPVEAGAQEDCIVIEELVSSLQLDDGALRMDWIAATPGGGPSWSTALDAGEGRLQSAARNLLSCGKKEEAKPLLARALSLGAVGWVEEAWAGVGGGLVPGLDSAPSALMADQWFKPLPDIDVPLLGGGSFSLHGESLGSVFVLDFWATWCEPCHDELPHLQALFESQRGQGLKALAINVEEGAGIAMPFAEQLGLTMPIGGYDSVVKRAFSFSRLPLVIVVDRWGKMRARWDGYEKGYERVIGDVANRLLAEKAPPSVEAATVLKGSGLLRVAWLRETPASIDGITVVAGAAGGSEILASSGRSLTVYGPDGQTGKIWNTSFPPGRLRSLAGQAEAGYTILGFWPGSARLLFFEVPEGGDEEWSSPSPVFDAVLLRPLAPGGKPTALLATFDGLLHVTGRGEEVLEVEDFKGVAALRAIAGQVVALEFEGRLSWLDRSLDISKRLQSSPEGWSLLVAEPHTESVGVLPVGVSASTVGRFLEGGGGQVAAATSGGQLVVIDQENGREIFRARWPGIEHMAAADLDGDGLDELILAAGSKLAAITAQSKPSAGPTSERSSRSASSASGRAASSLSREAQPVSTATAR